ncbi:hypothetical protein CH367_07910 [Leptospira barantonii]|uniref:ABM domain-containing protein n=1 Tax=Leptospira barantonii TaxID=2023184 RepID=A0ABX4NTE5_9LEPT|nr:hypothetical protein CH367_07910 [Leptospira barantonii]
MYFLRSYKNQSVQHIFSLENYDGYSLCKELRHPDNELQVAVEFEDMEELIQFYPKEIEKKPVCARCAIILNSTLIESL